MSITKESFNKFEKLRTSGDINMMDVKNGCLLSGLSREEYFEILKNYSELKEKHSERCECGGKFRDKIVGDECESCGKLKGD